MEVSRRRIFQKHLEPARPLRRCIHDDIEPQINVAARAQTLAAQEPQRCFNNFPDSKTNIGIEQFFKIVNLHEQKKGRISYTRDFLISLAGCPEAKKKPEFLPDYPITLTKARDPAHLSLHEMKGNGEKEDMEAEKLHSP
ncbi:uncharacterized protein C8orf88 homolog isoform X1 [Mugil cephalus]|uniref:uncharacterized protein C8orf88 homolog isoform X1 n=1 Tax=Mugil cephalus TaxID=48193 RepID=UPI001FB6FFA6|nr:uncharacterized protein C8orf88 homolog isoform X1 [Mugil cephalus]XP_047454209.1 uncharacterized protein C8orf88 homolog isoform X1 [Mugil cephalus]XP_047454210.1 uncharacterized protein C8orf88 homolog isoform X1 [Mugil cephalus]